MSQLHFTSLNSGSNGNCYYVGNDDEAVLIDAGLSRRETERRMERLGLSIKMVRAIFVSHEHADHITGLVGLSNYHQIPVYITSATCVSSGLPLTPTLTRHFTAFEPISIGSLSITAFPKYHDACDPHSFVVETSSMRVGIFTDIGKAVKISSNIFQVVTLPFWRPITTWRCWNVETIRTF